jgi:hypothetical protein
VLKVRLVQITLFEFKSAWMSNNAVDAWSVYFAGEFSETCRTWSKLRPIECALRECVGCKMTHSAGAESRGTTAENYSPACFD